MDKVFVEGLEIETIIGIYDWEREIKQIVRIDLEMAWDNKPAAKSEDIQFALNYKDVSKRLISHIGGSEFLLVETLRLSKPGAIRGAIAVGVHIQRTKDDIQSLTAYVPQPSVIEET
jgi:dihydroneopterin aldolase